MFGSKKINSEEYEKLSKTQTEIINSLNSVIAKMAIIETNTNSLRGLINRKLSGSKTEESDESQSINSMKYY